MLVHTAEHTLQLLQCKADEQPAPAVVDFWQTFSPCLTNLDVDVDCTQHEKLLQPQLLSQLTALTSMNFTVTPGGEEDGLAHDDLNLPELRTLEVYSYGKGTSDWTAQS